MPLDLAFPLGGSGGGAGQQPTTPAITPDGTIASESNFLLGNRDWQIDLTTRERVLVNGDFVLTTGLPSIIQDCYMALQLIRGEYYLDQTAGIPYLDQVYIKNPDAQRLTTPFRNCLLGVQGVKAILDLTLQFDSAARQLTVNFEVSTDLGALKGTTVLG